MSARRLVVGITGSSGVILGIRALQALQSAGIETHLVISPSAAVTIEQETDYKVSQVQALASVTYPHANVGATIASGSFKTDGMLIIPCSIKTLSAVANSFSADLMSRAADVTLKEGRPLILVVREAPFHAGHIHLMQQAAAAGAVIFPPVPAFYTHPQNMDDIVNNIVGRVLARIGIENEIYQPWEGLRSKDESWPPADLLALPAMTLATSGPAGEPHAAPVYFAASAEQHLYFFSETNTQHSQDLQANPQAAIAIHPIVQQWTDIRGLQLRGRVQVVPTGPAWEHAWQLYLEKFPFVVALKAELERNTLYEFIPAWVRMVDNRRGFGYKEEKTLP
jgi:flavin prenyltransferase